MKACRPLGTKKDINHSIHGRYIESESWDSCNIYLPYSNKGAWVEWATRLSLAQRKSGSVLQYETLAWSRKENWMVDYKHFKARKVNLKTEDGTYCSTADLVYSLLGSISRPCSSTFLTKSKVDRTHAAASVTVEWAICCPGQILPERWRY